MRAADFGSALQINHSPLLAYIYVGFRRKTELRLAAYRPHHLIRARVAYRNGIVRNIGDNRQFLADLFFNLLQALLLLFNLDRKLLQMHRGRTACFLAGIGVGLLLKLMALLLDANDAVRRAQLDLIAQQLGGTTVMAAETLQLEMQKLDTAFRLPLLQIAFPLIKNRSLEQLERIAELVQQLIEVDGVTDTFEFALSRVLRTHLNDAAHPQHRHGSLRLTQLPEAIGILFSVVAKQSDTEINSAYQKGMECLGRHEPRIKMLIETKQWPGYEQSQDWVSATDTALNQLDGLQVLDKQALVSALVLIISHDGKVSSHEAELLRAICATLHCPLPPFAFDADSI